MTPGLKAFRCGRERLEPIRAILNEAIANSTALWEYRPRSIETMEAWFETKATGGYPVIGATDEGGEFLGFASYGPFRLFPAYKYTVEHSVYVEQRFRGRGVGRFLLAELIAAAQGQGLHVMVGAIDASNAASVRLHRSLGFEHCGTVRQAGFKFGRWLDLSLYELVLPTPSQPVDG